MQQSISLHQILCPFGEADFIQLHLHSTSSQKVSISEQEPNEDIIERNLHFDAYTHRFDSLSEK